MRLMIAMMLITLLMSRNLNLKIKKLIENNHKHD